MKCWQPDRTHFILISEDQDNSGSEIDLQEGMVLLNLSDIYSQEPQGLIQNAADLTDLTIPFADSIQFHFTIFHGFDVLDYNQPFFP